MIDDEARDEQGERYAKQVGAMIRQLRNWRRIHGHIEVMIRFRIPEKTFVITDLAEALKQGLVLVDYNGKRMLRELGWLDERPEMPTVMMVKFAFDHVDDAPTGPQEEAPAPDPAA